LIEHHPLQVELVERIDWLVRLRWIAVAGTLVGIMVASAMEPGLPVVPLLAITAAIAGYNVVFLIYARRLNLRRGTGIRRRQSPVFVQVQIALDLIALIALLHFAGGVENPLAIFLVFHVIIASILLTRTASFLVALFAASLYAAMVLGEYAGILPHHHLAHLAGAGLYLQGVYVAANVFAMTVTLLLAEVMASSITTRLRERTQDLLQASQTCEIHSSGLTEANDKLRELDEARTRFIVTVTHELRAPVGTIISALDLVLGGYAAPEKQRKVLSRAQARAQELLDLIRDLLELSKARQIEGTQQAQPVQLAQVLENVVELTRVEAENKGLFFSVDVEMGASPVLADPDQMKAVWTNLISNAIKYTERGGVIVSLSETGDRVVGAVQDTGMGIAADDLPKLFEEFYRTGAAKAAVQRGTGIGLAIVKRIVESYGGQVWAESEVGKGSKFSFALPPTTAQPDAAAPAASVQDVNQPA
jgi:signal transduction histidine kinase